MAWPCRVQGRQAHTFECWDCEKAWITVEGVHGPDDQVVCPECGRGYVCKPDGEDLLIDMAARVMDEAWGELQTAAVELELVNPDLEQGFYFFDKDGALCIPEGWRPWWMAGEGLKRPEYKDQVETERVHSGAHAMKLFHVHTRYVGGIYQTVKVTPERWYRFRGWARALVAEGGQYLTCVGANPYGNHPNDVFTRWGRAEWTLEKWVRLEVVFQAWQEEVTVCCRGQPKWSVPWADSDWDEFSLEMEEAAQPEPEPGVNWAKLLRAQARGYRAMAAKLVEQAEKVGG